jgi:hypothetical protein
MIYVKKKTWLEYQSLNDFPFASCFPSPDAIPSPGSSGSWCQGGHQGPTLLGLEIHGAISKGFTYPVDYIYRIYTLWLFNIAMENHNFQ